MRFAESRPHFDCRAKRSCRRRKYIIKLNECAKVLERDISICRPAAPPVSEPQFQNPSARTGSEGGAIIIIAL